MLEVPAIVIFGTSYLVGRSGAVSPGPLLAYDIREAVQGGFLAGPYIATGHAILELLIVIVLALGLRQLFDSDPVIGGIGLLGGLVLLWMGTNMVRNPQVSALSASSVPDVSPREGIARPMLGGAVVSLSNPYWTIWWLTVGATLMTQSLELGLLGIAAFYVGHILADISWYSLVSFAVASGRRLISERVCRGVMLGCGVFLLGMGGYFIATGAALLA